MRRIKSRLFFFCFLFIFSSINASVNPVKSYVSSYQHSGYAIATDHKKEKNQLEQQAYILYSCFRLTNSSTPCFQKVKKAHLLLNAPGCKTSLFSKQYYTCYTAKRLHGVSDFPLYLRYRRLLI